MAVASVGEQEGLGVANAVDWRGAGKAGYENSVSRYRATLSLESRVNTVDLDRATGHTDGRGLSNLCVLEGVEVVLDVYDGCLLDRDPEEWIRFRRLGGFWFWGLVGS